MLIYHYHCGEMGPDKRIHSTAGPHQKSVAIKDGVSGRTCEYDGHMIVDFVTWVKCN